MDQPTKWILESRAEKLKAKVFFYFSIDAAVILVDFHDYVTISPMLEHSGFILEGKINNFCE